MCGINGIFAYHPAAVGPMRASCYERGIIWSCAVPTARAIGGRSTVGALLDIGGYRLSTCPRDAAQPMIGYDGKYVVVFNGEIYNYAALRAKLEADGVRFATTSDTEVLLHLYARQGAEMVRELRGMFAFAIWDELRGGLLLARDPYGIKPLYTANDGWTFRFASQVKALLAGNKVSRDPEPAGMVGFICSAACRNRLRSIARSAHCQPAIYSGSTAPAHESRSPTLQFARSWRKVPVMRRALPSWMNTFAQLCLIAWTRILSQMWRLGFFYRLGSTQDRFSG